MGVYIKGMEMPTSCGYCPLMHGTYEGDECYVGAHITEYQKIPDDCPLVPVPPHGRLIDADALDSSETDYLGNHLVYLVDIDDAPTIIPAEEGET